MGYTPYNKLKISTKRDGRKNPVASIVIPYDIIKKFGWEKGDLIFFNPYESQFSQDLTLINLGRCPEQQWGGEILKSIGELENRRIKLNKLLNAYPPKRRKEIIEFMEGEFKAKASS
jgi:hypothetical protein